MSFEGFKDGENRPRKRRRRREQPAAASSSGSTAGGVLLPPGAKVPDSMLAAAEMRLDAALGPAAS